MFTKFLVAAAALTAAAVATAPAQAKTNIDVNVGLGFGGGYGGGYGYGDGYYGGGYGYYPVYGGGYGGISCMKARKIVQNHGFYKVKAVDCSGKHMRFNAKQSGDWYRVKVNRWGNIVDVDPL